MKYKAFVNDEKPIQLIAKNVYDATYKIIRLTKKKPYRIVKIYD